MLVLTRKRKQAIKIGDDIEIKIIAIEGDQVKIGIEAPKSVEVHRKEVYEAIQLQNSEAANISTELFSSLHEIIQIRDK
ncbi:MAG TPA: carbon storage regulator CsrA [Pseudogracilibacillus sp.]|nr:carbon storage regulator CsrA [Pseudogracilibacillus sp.]